MSDAKPFKIPGFPAVFNDVRNLGIHLVAGRGSGKSRFLGRQLALFDYAIEIPTIVFDPGGDTIDNFLDAHMSFNLAFRSLDRDASERVVYVKFPTGEDYVAPFPLYYHLSPKESSFAVSQRFLEVIRRIDPELSTASVQGYNPLWQIGTMAGKILVALDMQITEMTDLILHVDTWDQRFKEALRIDPSVKDAVDFFTLQYPKWPEQWKASLTRKLTLFTAEDNLKALFGASTPGIDWATVIEKKQIVLLDFRDVHNEEVSRFLMLWVFSSLRDFIVQRGAGREPVSIIVDELSGMINLSDTEGSSILTRDFDKLLNTIMRRHNIYLTFAHQSMNQFSPSMQALLLGMGSQMFGRIDNMDDALYLAKSFFKIDPLKTKRTRLVKRPNVYIDEDGVPKQETTRRMSTGRYSNPLDKVGVEHIEEEPIEYTIPEQHYENAEELKGLKRFEFFVRVADKGEINLHSFDDGEDNEFIDELRLFVRTRLLEMGNTSRFPSIEAVLSEIDARLKKQDKDSVAVPQKIAPEKPKPKAKVKITGKRLND